MAATLSSDAYGSVFYLATGFHGLHVTGGLIAFLLIIGRTFTTRHYSRMQEAGAVVTSYYWHFVDVVGRAVRDDLHPSLTPPEPSRPTPTRDERRATVNALVAAVATPQPSPCCSPSACSHLGAAYPPWHCARPRPAWSARTT